MAGNDSTTMSCSWHDLTAGENLPKEFQFHCRNSHSGKYHHGQRKSHIWQTFTICAHIILIRWSTATGSGIVTRLADQVAAKDFTTNFGLRWMAKDIRYAMATGSTREVSVRTAVAALSIFRDAVAKVQGHADFSAVAISAARHLSNSSGIPMQFR